MSGFASRQFERAKRLDLLVTRRPRYVLGRFATVRDVYSRLNDLKDIIVRTTPLRMGDLYKPATSTLKVARSGHALSSRSAAEQVEEMRSSAPCSAPTISPPMLPPGNHAAD